jgi:hypothetical protein
MNIYFNRFGIEFCAELTEGQGRLDASLRQPKTIELWVGKLYLCVGIAR